ncbi:hypothetical protein GPZ77_00955 [Streptomyces sp. QHH-9511]|uniref:hypothetical protein n=1 Tax=Streptomyces sp. QHH-9511 TaxID=2684468 RepID=UPI001317F14C|nr:hypothetical protein [Streptomyces sp. QHH-9511]QGZ47166.1 hypothetical protein GPZ77_00955 [Streptomyces sp. QHH-9511]GGU01506.1 hypothetical protein GCM10010272_53220 [Streptomyces lateritius]
MSGELHTRSLPLSDGSEARTAVRSSEMGLTDEELLERYPAVRALAERWVAAEWEAGR